MGGHRHGKVERMWCDRCHVPLMGEACSICGSSGRPYRVSLPGDVRPCMGDTIDLLDSLIERGYGVKGALSGRPIVLNKIAGLDRTDEVIVDGRAFAVLRYDPVSRSHRLDLRRDGALALAPVAQRGVVTLGRVQGHLAGRWVGSGSIEVGEFDEGDVVIVRAGTLVGVAVARMSSGVEGDKVLRVRDMGKGSIELPPRVPRDRWVSANRAHLMGLESGAVSDIKSVVNNKRLPVTVSFSGGKDSLAAFVLAAKASKRVELIHADTGMEFPETVEYVRRFTGRLRARTTVVRPEGSLISESRRRGPPTKDGRWCCKLCKLDPIATYLRSRHRDGTVTVEGNRRLESFNRSRMEFVERNPHVPGQVRLSPLLDWTALDVWLYIWWSGMEYNPLYDHDYERVGCWMCPSALQSEYATTTRRHPKLVERWEGVLRDVAESGSLPSEWVSLGFWRWNSPPPKMMELGRQEGIDTSKMVRER